MERYILDTNVFFNMEAGLNIGKTTDEVMKTITVCGKKLRENGGGFFMPPKIVEEFLSFFENPNQKIITDMLEVITVKSPDALAQTIPASVFYGFVEESRLRTYRGMTVSEEEMIKASKLTQSAGELSKKDFEMRVGPAVKHFRDRFRQTTRTGFLDSAADLDVIMLARELNGVLVSTDEGVLKWGRMLGVTEVTPMVFGSQMSKLSKLQS